MSRYTDDELYQILTETGRLLKGVKPTEGEEYSLDAILAEFGQGKVQPEKTEESAPAPDISEPEGEPAAPEEPESEPVPEEPESEPAPEPKKTEDPSLLDTQRLRRTVAANMEKVLGPEKRVETVPPQRRRAEPTSALPDLSEPTPEEKPVLQVIEGGRREEPAHDSVFPEEPEGMHKISLGQVMSQTVESVLDEDDAILDNGPPLGERIRDALDGFQRRLGDAIEKLQKRRGASAWDNPEKSEKAVEEEPEPDMDTAAREEKRACKRIHRHLMLSSVPALLLLVLTIGDGFGLWNGLWDGRPWLRYTVCGVLLLAEMGLALPLWQDAVERLSNGRIGCEAAACLTGLVTLADCLRGAVTRSGNAPFAAPAAALVWVCLLGLLLRTDARRAAFHLADLGGMPPYGVTVTSAGACKQKGTLRGFYHIARQDDPPRKWQAILVPLYLSVATVLSGVVILSRKAGTDALWILSASLCAGLPLGLALSGTLPLKYLNQRLVKSGSAVAGYDGARSVSGSRRMVVTDDDLFPPGTVGLNGLKVYGEEIGKVVSYAASMTKVCNSQLSPLFEQLLVAEGGFHLPVEDLHYFEEGGVGGTIHGESVTMGSAYFMRKMHVTLPQELKLKTGVFLAVDGSLIAIFAIKYQPSRNVEWALRALRRNRIELVLAVRSCNVTPGLLKRKFGMDAKPLYPDVSTRLALSDLSQETAERSGAVIYREGLMPFAETAVGSRRMIRAVRWATVLAYLGGLCGLLLAYYFTGVGASTLLDPLRMLVFQGLWLIPTCLLSGLVRHY